MSAAKAATGGKRVTVHRQFLTLCLAAALAGCASHRQPPKMIMHIPAPAAAEPGGECAPFARTHSQVKIFGDASTWWDQAQGHYARRTIPVKGSVMVLYNYAGPNRAHVAVVRTIVNAREIRVDHSNWLNDGKIFRSDPVRDISPERDWSLVNIFNLRAGQWGVKQYPVRGFIGPDIPGQRPREDRISALWPTDPFAELPLIALPPQEWDFRGWNVKDAPATKLAQQAPPPDDPEANIRTQP